MENNEHRYARQVEQAYKNWQQAIHVFNNAITKEDIDFAIYNLEAKRKQYLRILNNVRNHAAADIPPQETTQIHEEDFT